jgi:hypothetical protein
MLYKLNSFKSDLYNVFVKGDANGIQLARVFIILAVPVMVLFLTGLHAVKN